jgi:translation initiation factor 3 subunit E
VPALYFLVEELCQLREMIDMRHFSTPLVQLQQRTWLIHWALFVYLKPQATSLAWLIFL